MAERLANRLPGASRDPLALLTEVALGGIVTHRGFVSHDKQDHTPRRANFNAARLVPADEPHGAGVLEGDDASAGAGDASSLRVPEPVNENETGGHEISVGSLPAFVVAYWITSSARPSTDCGIVSPSALAVFRLITSSNFVGCSTGRSAGLAPLRILST